MADDGGRLCMAIQSVEMRVGLRRVGLRREGNLADYIPKKGQPPPRNYLHHLNEDRKFSLLHYYYYYH